MLDESEAERSRGHESMETTQIYLHAFLRAASRAMEAMRKDLLAAKLAVPPIPNAATLMSAFQVYADRARRALAAAGLKEAL